MVATACSNVADCHPWFQFKSTCDLTGLIEGVSALLGGAARADDPCNRPLW
ncbi:hypothetical protein M2202_000782 [Bradyrhizobium japonicum]|nr:hypothetical protein [Bradyrhizobium japonicum]MCS4023312.1 hypothetical protein [Bradyrhizobium japonicum]